MTATIFLRAAGIRLLVAGCVVAGAAPSLAQVPAPPPALANWTGAIRCELQSQANGYAHQEVQTWTLTGAPTVQGSVIVYPATWNVTGQGWHDRSRYTSRRVTQWTVNVPGSNAPRLASIGFQLHPVGGGFDVTRRSAQLTVGGGYTGPDQFINDGVPKPPTRLMASVYEWQFPKIEASAPQTQLTGTTTATVKAFVGPLQPPEAQSTVTCAWALGRGSAPPLPPRTVAAAPPPAGRATSSTQSVQIATAVTPPPPATVSQGSGIIPAPTSTVTATTPTTGGASAVQQSTVAASGTTLGNSVATDRMMAPMPASPPICSASATGASQVITSMPQRGGMPSILPSQPAPTPTCVTIAKRLADLQDYVATTLADAQAVLASGLAPNASGSAAVCATRIADVDALVASLLQAMQTEYATLLAAAPTATEKAVVSKEQADATAQLRAWRDSMVASIDKICQQLK